MCVKVTEQESTICKLKLIFVRLLYIYIISIFYRN